MTDIHTPSLDRDRLRQLFDLRNNVNLDSGGYYADDPYPRWHELRTQAVVHPGTVHELLGYEGHAMFHGCRSPTVPISRPFPTPPATPPTATPTCSPRYRRGQWITRRHRIRAKPPHDGRHQAPPLSVPRAALLHARQSAVVDPELD